mmetsp:Transcript_14803/g.35141  ORF Transcript_14803/g.35141 Transcript_14803/m.35141 type:complete len:245 (+) Transcript_14803:631-1365(+)
MRPNAPSQLPQCLTASSGIQTPRSCSFFSSSSCGWESCCRSSSLTPAASRKSEQSAWGWIWSTILQNSSAFWRALLRRSRCASAYVLSTFFMVSRRFWSMVRRSVMSSRRSPPWVPSTFSSPFDAAWYRRPVSHGSVSAVEGFVLFFACPSLSSQARSCAWKALLSFSRADCLSAVIDVPLPITFFTPSSTPWRLSCTFGSSCCTSMSFMSVCSFIMALQAEEKPRRASLVVPVSCPKSVERLE